MVSPYSDHTLASSRRAVYCYNAAEKETFFLKLHQCLGKLKRSSSANRYTTKHRKVKAKC